MKVITREACTVDVVAIKKMIEGSPALDTDTLLRDIVSHIKKKDCVARVMIANNKLSGVWLSKEFEEYTSLSFFYISEDMRRRVEVLQFFQECLTRMPEKPILIGSKDITGFERYVKPVEGNPNVYMFKGLR